MIHKSDCVFSMIYKSIITKNNMSIFPQNFDTYLKHVEIIGCLSISILQIDPKLLVILNEEYCVTCISNN